MSAFKKTVTTKPHIIDGEIIFYEASNDPVPMKIDFKHETAETEKQEQIVKSTILELLKNFPNLTVKFSNTATFEMFDIPGKISPTLTLFWNKSLKCDIQIKPAAKE